MTSASTSSTVTVLVLPAMHRFTASCAATVLEAALVAGVRLPSTCRNGTCRACLCKMLSGEVQYRVAWPGLSGEEKNDGWILPCVAQALSDLVIEQPGATPMPPLPPARFAVPVRRRS